MPCLHNHLWLQWLQEDSGTGGRAMNGEAVLVVGDEAHILELATRYLQNEGYQVLSAATGAEALQQIDREQPSLVILDRMLPDVDGWDVCRQIRGESALPIIMLTARSDDVDRIVGLELGADDHVTKPFNPRELVARARDVLRGADLASTGPDLMRAGPLTIDTVRREAHLGWSPLKFENQGVRSVAGNS